MLIKSTLGGVAPIFGDGNTVAAVAVSSVGIWLFHFLILRGVQQAAAINKIVTIAKVIPILVFIVILIFAFKMDLFSFNLYGGDLTAGIFDQVRATMLVTVFVFIGIEGASVYSRYAKERSDVGAATIMGFIIVTSLMVLVSLLPYAVLARADIAGMRQPSMAAVLESVVGPWGAIFVSIGLLVSVLGAYLAWSLICAEVMFTAARTKDMPSVFARENANKTPVVAVWVTSAVVQLIVVTTYWSRDAFSLMLNLTSAMTLIPYFLVAAYAFKIAQTGETYDTRPEGRSRDYVIAVLATLYTAFMLWAGGLRYILLACILFAPGTALYWWACKEQGKPMFRPVAADRMDAASSWSSARGPVRSKAWFSKPSAVSRRAATAAMSRASMKLPLAWPTGRKIWPAVWMPCSQKVLKFCMNQFGRMMFQASPEASSRRSALRIGAASSAWAAVVAATMPRATNTSTSVKPRTEWAFMVRLPPCVRQTGAHRRCGV